MYSGTFVIRNQPHLPLGENSLATDADERELLLSFTPLVSVFLLRSEPSQRAAHTKSLEGM